MPGQSQSIPIGDGSWSVWHSRDSLSPLAGAFLSHFVPFSLGTVGLTFNYYQKLSTEPSQARTAAILPIVFGTATTVLMVAFVSPLTFIHLAHRF
jgi:hypothetical protein